MPTGTVVVTVVLVVAYWLPTGTVVVDAYWRCNEARPGCLRGISKEIANLQTVHILVWQAKV